MSKTLDLSEFDKITEMSPRPLLRETNKGKPATESTSLQPVTTSKKSHEVGQYKFIPVGFSQRHLDMLDEAVYKLKKEGCLKASRSAIIRELIERYAGEVIETYDDKKE